MTPLELLALLVSGSLGAALARLLRLPLWPMTGAIAGAAAGHAVVDGGVAVPGWWSLAGQVLVGSVVGCSIGRGVLREFRAVLLPGALAVLTTVGLGVAAGLGIAATGLLPLRESVFGSVPGGVGEMVAAATALEAQSAVVAGMHVARLLAVLSLLPLLVRWALRWQRPDDGPAGREG